MRMDEERWMSTLLLLLLLGVTTASLQAQLSLHIDDFIRAVKQVEDEDPGSEPLLVLEKLRRAAGLNHAFVRRVLPDADPAGLELTPTLSLYIHKAVHHRVKEDWTEEGVVLTPDGTTVALAEVLMGLEAGFRSDAAGRPSGLIHLTLGHNLGLALDTHNLSAASARFGPDGCWDSTSTPQVFTLSEEPSPLTTAQVHGGMDGVLLGTEVSDKSRTAARVSVLLSQYYCRQLGAPGMDGAPRLVSRRRRDNFRELVSGPELRREAVESAELQRRSQGGASTEELDQGAMTALMEEFIHRYMECPAIIPRCAWGARPYRGTPTNLSLPLDFLFVHHTAVPHQPCLSFSQCSHNMRSMQRFHQDTRGWDDIGYSFVAGSDGFLYEGRGWRWRGAHTLGQNSRGYGVAFIGDYTSATPTQHAMALVRDWLTSCAVGGGRLGANFTLQGHRQVVNTSCPGHALFSEITGWPHFGP